MITDLVIFGIIFLVAIWLIFSPSSSEKLDNSSDYIDDATDEEYIEEPQKAKNNTQVIYKEKVTHTNYNKQQSNIAYKQLHKNIIPYLNFRGIYKFYHFTDIENLESIIRYGGLYSWYGLERQNIISSTFAPNPPYKTK